MKMSPVISLVLSLVFAGAAVLGARLWLGGNNEDEPVAASTEPEPVVIETRDVLVAVRDIPRGVPLDPAWFDAEPIPVDDIPRGAFESRSELEETGLERPTLIEIASGEVLSEKMLLAAGMRASLSSKIRPGMRAFTVQMDNVAGVAGFVLPGDTVDVLYIANGGEGIVDDQPVRSQGAASEVLLQNIEVMAVDLNDDLTGNEPSTFRTATLAVTLEEAQTLSVAAKSGTLLLARRGSADDAYEQAEAVRLRPDPRPRPVAAAPAAPRQPSGAQIAVIMGNQEATVQVPKSE